VEFVFQIIILQPLAGFFHGVAVWDTVDFYHVLAFFKDYKLEPQRCGGAEKNFIF
jgi:hypothetical protein